jgi:uncharacterized protein
MTIGNTTHRFWIRRRRLSIVRRLAMALRTEVGVVRFALGVVALHVVDDSYLQPEPGVSPADHLVSGLIPVLVLAVAIGLYPRPRAGLRAMAAGTLGALGIAFGIPGAYYLTNGAAAGDDYTGLLALAAGAVLLLSAPVTLWRSRKPGGSRRRRYLRRAVLVAAAPVATLALIWFVVFPIGFPYVYTHTGPGAKTPARGVPADRIAVTTSDSIELAAWYVPSKNRAAVIVFPGPARATEARMLIRHGYGVLLLEPRGEGASQGDPARWAGARDLLAGANYLRSRPDVDAARIGAFGFSVGGELLLEAAAQSDVFKAVVSEGAGGRVGDEDLSGPERVLAAPNLALMTAAVTLFANHAPPPPIAERIGRIAPRPVFLIYAEHGMGGEDSRQPVYYAAAGEPKAIWEVPGAQHTGGIEAQPAEYERRVIGFLDGALLR